MLAMDLVYDIFVFLSTVLRCYLEGIQRMLRASVEFGVAAVQALGSPL